jgi:hypothetical protein
VILPRERFVKNARSLLQGLLSGDLAACAVLWSKSGLLLFSHLLRGDFRQLVRAGFTDEDGNFVIGWLAAMLCGESLDQRRPAARSARCTFRAIHSRHRESRIHDLCLWNRGAALFRIPGRAPHAPARSGKPRSGMHAVHKARCLERLPAALNSVIGQIGSNGMCVQLRVEFTAGVVAVCGDNPVGRRTILIGTVQPDTRCRVALGFCKRFPDALS